MAAEARILPGQASLATFRRQKGHQCQRAKCRHCGNHFDTPPSASGTALLHNSRGLTAGSNLPSQEPWLECCAVLQTARVQQAWDLLASNERLLIVAASTFLCSLSHTALRPVLPVFAKVCWAAA